MLTGPRMHEVQEVALQMVMLLDQQREADERLDRLRMAHLASGRLPADQLWPAPAPAPAADRPHTSREDEPHPSQLEWSVPTEEESAELVDWIAERATTFGVVSASDLDAAESGWV